MDFIPKNIEKYSEDHTTEESEILQNINRETHLKSLMPRMLSGNIQGKFIGFLASISQAKTILEIGSFTGYSAIAIAELASPNSKIYCIEKNEELFETINNNIEKAGIKNRTQILIGKALEILPNLKIEPDFVFLDADKINYLNYYKILIEKIPVGGIIVADNVLWSGKVIEPIHQNDHETQAIIDFNVFVQNDIRVLNILLPVRDGLMLIKKL